MTLCTLCPRQCRVNRNEKPGFCGMGIQPKLARAALHFWEEPCISGTKGSGALFFSGCTLRCAYCQNHSLSHEGHGKEISVQRLSEIFQTLYDQGAQNLNFVTATPFVPQVLEALRQAGLTERHARALLKLPTEQEKLQAIGVIARLSMSVARAEQYIEGLLDRQPAGRKKANLNAFLNSLTQSLSRIQQSGIAAISERRETGESIVLTITIPK